MSLMTVPEVGSLGINDEYPPDCDWCGTWENVRWANDADKHLCDDCYDEWKREFGPGADEPSMLN